MQNCLGSATSEGGTELVVATGGIAVGQGLGNEKNFLGLIFKTPRIANALSKSCV